MIRKIKSVSLRSIIFLKTVTMRNYKSLLCTTNSVLETDLLRFMSQFTSLGNIEVVNDIVLCIEKINRVTPEIFLVDIDQKSIDVKVFFQIINRPAIMVVITEDISRVLDFLDNGCFDVWISNCLDFEYFCKKVGKIVNLLNRFENQRDAEMARENSPPSYKPVISEIKKDYLYIKYKKSSIKVKLDNILYIKNEGSVLNIYLEDSKNELHKSTLSRFLKLLPDSFIRINNSTIINVGKIEKINRSEVVIDNQCFEVSRIYKEGIREHLQR